MNAKLTDRNSYMVMGLDESRGLEQSAYDKIQKAELEALKD